MSHFATRLFCLGPAPSLESYLRIPAIIAAAKATNAEAIHPGYGFLAENADFARAVAEAGITFIGPDAQAMEIMGSKTSARRTAVAAGVPIVPGTVEPLQSLEEAQQTAEQFGYPVMLKASAGGGGKGMRLVASLAELRSGFESAKSEAAAAFGDSAIYLEKAVCNARATLRFRSLPIVRATWCISANANARFSAAIKKVIEECPFPDQRREAARSDGCRRR